ncbi:U3 small nucleolar RNA-associated protein 11 [Aspergillus campestris IBT 28561]|uniref:U3 small nucleolar RNA-associated protein 11 n=1 Tax=Aspergillus campestris (strain IBT 28561) TaxID=1392248 RepID=A0A2I1DCM7_ASPC2|nr:U3 small nucleolar RNA-associated protein 11 [Aspergillus campestris IBT 28561]PKY07626.1 U3 small nucleolar RNA-associated protein 11 [Aspergillus campestris IBT 28561]
MSTMRNAVQRRQHRERGQLAGREKWGILEKHKDYSLRAKDYNTKKAQIKRLQEKAHDRNPDEFAFGMVSSRQGKHGGGVGGRDSAAARGLSHDAIKLYKTQDAGYLRTVGERVRRQMERLEEEVRLQGSFGEKLGEEDSEEEGGDDESDFEDFDLDDAPASKKKRSLQQQKKVVYADDRKEQKSLRKKRLRDEDASDEDEDEIMGGEAPKKKSQKQLLAERQALVDKRRARKLKKRAAEARQTKLAGLRKQYADITAAERELDWQRGRMDNIVGGTNKNGIKWKIRERKK